MTTEHVYVRARDMQYYQVLSLFTIIKLTLYVPLSQGTYGKDDFTGSQLPGCSIGLNVEISHSSFPKQA